MKNFLALALLLTLSAIAAHAQTACDPEAEAAIYTRFLVEANVPIERQAAASVTAKEYLTKFGECTTEPEKKITEYLKGWLETYDASIADFKCTVAVSKQPAKAFEICQPYLARNPDNLRAHLLLSSAGIKSGVKDLRPQTVSAARKALALVKSGKSVERWHVADSKDEAIATLEFFSAYYTLESTPADTVSTMHALAKSTTSFSKDPNTYFYLAQALQQSELKRLKADYVAKCGGTEPPDECDTAWSKIEAVMDRVIDAYARSIALSTGKPEFARIAAIAKPELAKIYKLRHEKSTDADVDKFVVGVLSTQIP